MNGHLTGDMPVLAGIPVDFFLFVLTLIGIAVFHRYALQVALTGLAAIVLYKLGCIPFRTGTGLGGLASHMYHEWVILTNLLCLLVGFALLSNHFGESHLWALSNMYPEAKSVGLWLRHGWHIAIAYAIGFLVMLALLGWHADAN